MCVPAGGDYETVWQEHCQDSHGLLTYAGAMHQLATEIWEKKPETRIDWCYETCLDYFHRGGLEKVLRKEERKRKFQQEMRHAAVDGSVTNIASAEKPGRENAKPRLEAMPLSIHDRCESLPSKIQNIHGSLEVEVPKVVPVISSSACHVTWPRRSANHKNGQPLGNDLLGPHGPLVTWSTGSDTSSASSAKVHSSDSSLQNRSAESPYNTLNMLEGCKLAQMVRERQMPKVGSESELIFGSPEGLDQQRQNLHAKFQPRKYNTV